MAIEGGHEAVMTAEVIEFLAGRRTVVDMTVGSGGHAAALLAAGVSRLVGVDRDPEALQIASHRLSPFGDRVRLVGARFSEVDEDVVGGSADGVLFDLGVSSMQLDRPERGFGYRVDGPLDMRMGEGSGTAGPSAADLVNDLPERDLADLIYRFGEEPRSRRIAAAIVRRRPIRTTDELTGIIVSAVGKRPGGPHPARRTFQALRIAVNRELEELTAALPPAAGLLGPGGRVVVISYHSLEDRIVKRSFRDDGRLEVLTKKPLVASTGERARNPRARSAKLRAAQRSIPEAA
ncbi:MAG TPA: 16S rRNA (cytosine(1402)-N(4))-methyltransferase RsmH [Actinomycetota bacterium]